MMDKEKLGFAPSIGGIDPPPELIRHDLEFLDYEPKDKYELHILRLIASHPNVKDKLLCFFLEHYENKIAIIEFLNKELGIKRLRKRKL